MTPREKMLAVLRRELERQCEESGGWFGVHGGGDVMKEERVVYDGDLHLGELADAIVAASEGGT